MSIHRHGDMYQAGEEERAECACRAKLAANIATVVIGSFVLFLGLWAFVS